MKGPFWSLAFTIASTALNPDPLDGPQAEVDCSFPRHAKVEISLVDIRLQDFNSETAAILDVFVEELVALGTVHFRREHRGHVLSRVMGLEIGGLKSDQGVSRAMRLVEAITAEVDDQVEDLGRFLTLEPLGQCSLQELVAALGDHVGFFLRDRLDGGIRLRELDAPQAVHDAHDLFLIDHHPISFLEDLLEHGVQVSRLPSTVLDVDVIIDHAAVQAARGDRAHWWR